MNAATPVLEARHFSKRFGGTLALDDIGLTIDSGSVHGMVGHNGSGKSTFIKILAGYHAPEPGAELTIGGRPVRVPLAPGRFRSLGMAFVHQDPGLIASLSVVENLRIGAIARGRLGRIAWRDEVRRCEELLAEFGVSCDPRANVETLRPWQRPMLAIIRAVDEIRRLLRETGQHRGVLILDEPTANLADSNVGQLFDVVRRVQSAGFGVLFVSHDLDEVLAVTDHVTVLRDGRVAGSGVTSSFTRSDLVRLIVGHDIPPAAPAPAQAARRTDHLTEVHGLSGPGVRDVDLSVAPGEIVGVSGLTGSGFAELGPLLIGALPAWEGADAAGHHDHRSGHDHAWRGDCSRGLLCTRRPAEGRLHRRTDRGGKCRPAGAAALLPRGLAASARAGEPCAGADYALRRATPPDPTLTLESLSGGNQQKVLLAKWLQLEPRLLILQEPTQGVDVGAREQIFAILRAFVAHGGRAVPERRPRAA